MLSCRRTILLGSNPDTLPSRTAPEAPSALADDRTLLYEILMGADLDGHDAYLFTHRVEEMASANLIHRFESKLEAQNAKLGGLTSKCNLMLWFIGICVSIIIALNMIGKL